MAADPAGHPDFGAWGPGQAQDGPTTRGPAAQKSIAMAMDYSRGIYTGAMAPGE
jgi:hypothetical protein